MFVEQFNTAEGVREETWSVLESLAREGARKLLQQALENEVAEYIEAHVAKRDENGRRLAVRNGALPERSILTGLGPMAIRQPRVDDRKLKNQEGAERFSSMILPRYLRRVPSVDNLIPVLYLKGISSKEFLRALSSILGEGAKGLSATNIVRLKKGWEQEYKGWALRDLSDKEYVYIWADGVYFNIRLEDERSCILVIIGCNLKGEKELLAISDGYRESELSWVEMLRDLKARGLKIPPKLAIGDGSLGFWAALGKEFPETAWQRCWVHKTANVLDKLPKGMQSKAKSMIHQMYMADSKEKALKAYRHFADTYRDKYPKAVECLQKDEEVLFSFYDFPAAHWIHIRTTNPIESTFATVRHRTRQTKGCGSRKATMAMVFKLGMEAQKKWRRLNGSHLLAKVIEGVKFIDGEEKKLAA